MDEKSELKRINRQNKILIGSIVIVLTLIIGLVIGMYYSFSHTVMQNLTVETFTPEEIGIEPEVTTRFNQYNNTIKNFLVIGIDSDQNQNLPQRSDSMIIVTIDDFNKSIKMSSLMRDTMVKVPGYGSEKLNHAYAYGGAKLLLKTINQNFELNLEDYVLVDFNNLIKAVDAIGGIDLYMTSDEVFYANLNIKHINKLNGTQVPFLEEKSQTVHVDGAQALSYARIRYLDSDYKRAERQRTVLVQIYQRLRETPLTEMPNLAVNLSQYVKTTLQQNEIIDIVLKALGSEVPLRGIHFPTVHTSEESSKGTWHLKWDEEATISEMHEWIFRDVDPLASTQSQ